MKQPNFFRGVVIAILLAILAVLLLFGLRPAGAAEAVRAATTPPARNPFILQSGVASIYFPEGTQSVGLLITLHQPFPDMAYTFTFSANSQNCEFPLGYNPPNNAAGLPEFDFGRLSTSQVSLMAALDSPAGPGGAYYCVEWQAMSQGVKTIP